MSLRVFALILAIVLAVPAAIALLRPGSAGDRPTAFALRRPLDALWAVVPVALLIVLGILSAAA